ncbi:MAG: hypothetical protein ACK5LT_01455 [Lachnospirales bacterium]
MKILKNKFIPLCLILIFMLTMAVNVFAATSSYSRPLPTLNLVSGQSNQATVSAPSLPDGATITSITMTGSKSGTGINTWHVSHDASGDTGSALYSSNGTVMHDFDGLTADSSWTIYFTSTGTFQTITNGQIEVEYTY